MAHEIDQTVYAEGQAMYAVEPAWHNLGRVKPNTFSAAEAIEEIGLGFNVSKRELFTLDKASGLYTQVKDYVATARDDSNAVLGVVSPGFVPLQNKTMFSVVDQAIEAVGLGGKVEYESAGSLKGGRQVWALARLPQEIVIEHEGLSDRVIKYLYAGNGHDGSRSSTFKGTTIRVVCWNTAEAAEAEKTIQVSWHHTKNIEENIPNMVAAIRQSLEDLREWGDIAQAMAKKRLESDAEIDTFAKLVTAALSEAIRADNEHAKKRKLDGFKQILSHFSSGNDFLNPGEEPTVWRAYNAISQYIEHEARAYKTPEKRFESLVLGAAAAVKARAFRRLAAMLPAPKKAA